MKVRINRLMLPLALVLVTGAVAAQEGAVFDASGAPAAQPAQARSTILDKASMIDVIVGVWRDEGAHLADADSGRTWEEALRARLRTADLHNLRRAMEALEFDDMLAALSGRSFASGEGPQQLGDEKSDLVYTPITPCRILDTRVTGSPMGAATTRGFDVSAWWNGSFVFQGGFDGNCGIPARPAAVAVNLAAVTPASAGYLTAFPRGAERPLAATVNYPAGGVTSNEVQISVSTTATYDMSVYSHRQSHVVGDIVGYYMAPEATELDCTVVTVEDVVIAAGGREFSNIFCPAGFIAMGGGARTDFNAGMRLEASNPNATGTGWFASLANENATSRTATFKARCCRIPGR